MKIIRKPKVKSFSEQVQELSVGEKIGVSLTDYSIDSIYTMLANINKFNKTKLTVNKKSSRVAVVTREA